MMQGPVTADVHPQLLIKDHGQGPHFGRVFLALDGLDRWPPSIGEYCDDSSNTDRHMRSYPHRHEVVRGQGIPVRVWCWPGNTSDVTVLPEVRDGMRDW